MKKKKYMVLIGLMVVFSSLLVLSGCDQILEAMYYGGDKAPKGNNEVWIEVDIDPGLADWNAEVWGKIESANLGPDEPDYYIQTINVPIDYQYDEQGNPIPKAYLDFWGIPGSNDRPREYKIVVWIDKNGNQWPDWDEPQAPAVWNNFDEQNPDNTWPDDIFRFPNEHDWSTIGGNAYLGAKAMNLNFDIRGGKYAVEAGGTDGATYWLQAQDPDRQISHVYYEIDSTQDWTYYGGGDIDFIPPVSENDFNVTYDNLPQGDYWLTLNVDYADGSFASRRYLIRAGVEEGEYTSYTLTININQLNTGPVGIPANTEKTFFVQIFDSNKDVNNYPIVDQANKMTVDETGYVGISGLDPLWNTLSALTYHASGVSGQDWVRIVIDMNNNDTIDRGDMEAWMPISLMSNETESVIGIDSWDFYPIF